MGKQRNTRKNPTYPEILEIPESKQNTRKYTIVFFCHSYPTQTRPATRYFVQYPTRHDPILKNPTRWALPILKRWIGLVVITKLKFLFKSLPLYNDQYVKHEMHKIPLLLVGQHKNGGMVLPGIERKS